MVKLHSLYKCRQTPYACSPAVDSSVLTVDVMFIVFGSVSAPRPILGVDSPSVLSWFLVDFGY